MVVVVVSGAVIVVVVFGPGLFARWLCAPVFSPHVFGVRQVVVFLVFHPPVLEPYLDLPFRQYQRMSDLNPPPPGQVFVEVELFL